MGFYDLSKQERVKLVEKIKKNIVHDLSQGNEDHILDYFADQDTYIRKTAYLAFGKTYMANAELRAAIINMLKKFIKSDSEKVRQTTINAAGEVGMIDFTAASDFFDEGLFDPHHSVRNAVIGSIKKMSEKNPKPTLAWARHYLHHPNKEIRREICHGIELRGRKYPQDILPLLKELQHDPTARVRNTLIHVLGQIAYKKGCLETVIKELNTWDNQELMEKAIDEIVDVHQRYNKFAYLTQEQAIGYIDKNFTKNHRK